MNLPRIIPVLLLAQGGLVKTVRFRRPNYIGDPINAVKIFNEKEVDELVLLDIEAAKKNEKPAFAALERIAQEAFMPIGYGGGIRTVEDAATLFRIGFEKVIVNSAFSGDPELIRRISDRFGSQSVVGSIDVKKRLFGGLAVYARSGSEKIGDSLLNHAKKMENMGAGEIILQNIDRDGTMDGYDLPSIRLVTDHVSIPVVALGGAGKLSDFKLAMTEAHASAAAAGSLFVYQGKLKGILIQYPERKKIMELFSP